MPLQNGIKPIEGTRSKTHLIKSGHAAPAADIVLSKKFLTDSTLKTVWNEGVLIDYQYGGHDDGGNTVTIPQGRFVGVTNPEFNFHDQLYKTPIILPGLSNSNNVIGMVPYNICKDFLEEDKFGGNKPGFITTEYVVLPFMPGHAPSTEYTAAGIVDEENRLTIGNKMPWGAVLGELSVGDYIKATPSGRACKWVKGTDLECDRVGICIEQDLNQTAWGFLEWMLLNPAEKDAMDKTINRSGVSSLPSDYGYPFDPTFREGQGIYEILNQYQSKYTENPTGLEGLHDGTGNYKGFGRNDSMYNDMAIGNIPAGLAAGTVIVLNAVDAAGNKAKNIVAEGAVIKIDGTVVSADKVTIDEKYATIAIEIIADQAGKAVTASYQLKHYGTPSYLDFKDVIGSCSILLQL